MPGPLDAKRDWLSAVLGLDLPPDTAPDADAPHGDEPKPDMPSEDDLYVPRPILKDCKPLRNHVAGPAHHVLCATHGHVYDEKVSMIIANSVEEYDAQYPIPRPIVEGVCKPAKGKMPYAPKEIAQCEVHGHVLDLKRGEVVANTVTMYYRAHPEHAPPPSPDDEVPDGPWNPFYVAPDEDPNTPYIIGPDGEKIYLAPNPHPLPPPPPPPPDYRLQSQPPEEDPGTARQRN